jgi:hypothetical protein
MMRRSGSRPPVEAPITTMGGHEGSNVIGSLVFFHAAAIDENPAGSLR